MKKLSMTAVAFVLFLQSAFCAGFEWKSLHEKADKENLTAALTEVVKDPRSLEALYVLGLVNLNAHKDEDARKVFQDMLNLDPENIGAKWGMAEVLRRQHKFDVCEALLEDIIRSDPEFSPAYISLGYMLYDKQEYERSIRLAQKVIKQGMGKVDLTNYTRAYLIIGGAKGMLADRGGPFAKMIHGTHVLPYFKKAEKLQPGSAGVLFGLGSFYLLAPSIIGGDKKKAIGYLERSVSVDPNFADAYARLAQAWRLKGDEKKFKAYLEIALSLDSQNELALGLKDKKR